MSTFELFTSYVAWWIFVVSLLIAAIGFRGRGHYLTTTDPDILRIGLDNICSSRDTLFTMVPTPKRESAGEIAKRYGLADLVRTRMLARRLYLNSLAKRASISLQDSLDMLEPDLAPLELSMMNPRRYYLFNDPVASRRGLPAFESRYGYNRRLAEIEAERLEAEERAERMLTRYMSRSKSKKIPGPEGEKDKHDNDNNDDDIAEDNAEHADKDEVDDDLLDDDLYPDGLEPGYLDYLNYPYDMAPWRYARRLYRHRLYPYRYRPVGATSRLLAGRLRDL